MFTNLFGLPAHVLIIHAAVVFIPLAALFAIGYALVPGLRRHIWWLVPVLGVVAPLTGWAARLSGERYRQFFVDQGANGAFLDQLNKHQSFGQPTAWWATGLGVAMLVMALWVIPGPARLIGGAGSGALASRPVRLVIVVLNVALAVVALYYVIQTGDSGARSVHSPIT